MPALYPRPCLDDERRRATRTGTPLRAAWAVAGTFGDWASRRRANTHHKRHTTAMLVQHLCALVLAAVPRTGQGACAVVVGTTLGVSCGFTARATATPMRLAAHASTPGQAPGSGHAVASTRLRPPAVMLLPRRAHMAAVALTHVALARNDSIHMRCRAALSVHTMARVELAPIAITAMLAARPAAQARRHHRAQPQAL